MFSALKIPANFYKVIQHNHFSKLKSFEIHLSHNIIAGPVVLRKYSNSSVLLQQTMTENKMQEPLVEVTQGKLKGLVLESLDGKPYYSFKGIPYAQPPVGELRFKAPAPPKPWDGIYDATEHGAVCPQIEPITTNITEGNEDCLFLNIYTRSLGPHTKKPVMFFIHGGGFLSGSGNTDMYGPDYLLQHDVVLVTINYRLEVLGFLCLDIPEVPGNAGMKDQVAALKWVKENIEKFGGDSNNVTIFGESAGAASVAYHLVSEMSKGLFSKAIAQSGCSLNYWARCYDAKERSLRAAKALGCDKTDPKDVLEFMQKVPARELVKLTMKSLLPNEKNLGVIMFFVPSVEKTFKGVESFLKKDIYTALDKITNDVPLLTGYNNSEGIMLSRLSTKKLELINKKPQYRIPRDIGYVVSANKLKEFSNRMMKFYFGDRPVTKDDEGIIKDLETDAAFASPLQRFIHFYKKASKSPVYMYRLCYDTEMNFIKTMMGSTHLKGTNHADDLFYLFSTEMTKDIYKNNDSIREKVYTITKLWTNFAKTGNPTSDDEFGVKWHQYSLKAKEYLNIDDELTTGEYADKERAKFWNQIYLEAGLPSIVDSKL